MKKLSSIILALASFASITACAEKINFDSDYIIAEQKKCNLKPLQAVEERCKSERADGKQFKPGCDAFNHVKMVNSSESLAGYFSSSARKKTPQCPK